ncbi:MULTISPECIES: hypothetical protein [Oscillatoriales]|nr:MULTISPECIES: hypothetical protein [Oscillatoriales]
MSYSNICWYPNSSMSGGQLAGQYKTEYKDYKTFFDPCQEKI